MKMLILATLCCLAFAGCESPARGRASGKQPIPADGPDNVRIVDPVHGPNW